MISRCMVYRPKANSFAAIRGIVVLILRRKIDCTSINFNKAINNLNIIGIRLNLVSPFVYVVAPPIKVNNMIKLSLNRYSGGY